MLVVPRFQVCSMWEVYEKRYRIAVVIITLDVRGTMQFTVEDGVQRAQTPHMQGRFLYSFRFGCK